MMGWQDDPVVDEDQNTGWQSDPIVSDEKETTRAGLLRKYPEYATIDEQIQQRLQEKYPKDYEAEIDKKEMLSFARKQLKDARFPNLRATAIGLGADVVAPITRLYNPEAADKIQRFSQAYEQAASEQDVGGAVPPIVKRGLRGAGRTVPTMLLAGAAGGPYAALSMAATQETDRALTMGKDAGLSGKKLGTYALSQGALEGGVGAIFQRIGLGGVENIAGGRQAVQAGVKNALKSLGVSTLQELPEELITEIGHNIANKVSGVDPKATTLDSLGRTAADTTVQTLITMGMVGGPSIIKSAIDKQVKIQKEITSVADNNETPSRKQWKEWGFSPDEGKSLKTRREFIQQFIEQRAAVQQAATPEMQAQIPFVQEATEQLAPVTGEVVQQPAATIEAAQQPVVTEQQAALGPIEQAQPIIAGPAAEALQAEAEATRPIQPSLLTGEVGAAPIGGRLGERARPDIVGGIDISPDNPEASRRLQAAHGITTTPLSERIVNAATKMWHYATRAQIHLPNNEKFGPANETFRLIKAVPQASKDEAIRTTAAVLDPLGPEQVRLFERYAVIQNQLAALDAGQPLRFGFTNRAEVEGYKAKLDAIVEATPEVKAALAARREVVRDVVGRLSAYNLLPESALQNADTYYHQQVHLYQAAQQKYAGATRLPGGKKSFQKKRVVGPESLGEEFDYNTSYIEAETSWMADAFSAIRTYQLFDQLMGQYDVRAALEQEAKRTDTSVEALLKESPELTMWLPRPGNIFFPAFSIPDRIAEKLQSGLLEEYRLTDKDIRTVIAIGAEKPAHILPRELVAQLEEMKRSEEPHWLTQINRKVMNAWKAFSLLMPKRIIPYNLRNLTGDLDPVLAADPRMISETRKAFSELKKYHRSNLSISKELRLARDLGVVSSGFFSSEISELGDLEVFRRLRKERENLFQELRHPVRSYMGFVGPMVDLRENILRYSAFRYYLKELEKGIPAHLGASKAGAVKVLKQTMGNEVAAANLARNLVGDYGNMTAMGEWLRRNLFPFWAFTEINAKRYPRLAINAWMSGHGKKAASLASVAAVMRVGQMYAAFWAWNNLIMPALTGDDDEEELPEYERANPHINLGRNPDGTIRVFRNVGALGDFLEWFGLNELPGIVEKYRNNQAGPLDVAKEVAKAPIEKLVGYVRPDIMGGFSVLTGQSLFPSPFSPRSTTRGEAIGDIVGLRDEYNWAKGMALGTGETARKNYWQRWMVGVVDPREAALHEITDLRERFLESKGVHTGGVYPVSEYRIPRNAAIAEDYDSFVAWKHNFETEHPSNAVDKFYKMLERIDPVASRLNDADEFQFIKKYLTPEQRSKLDIARDYASQLQRTLAIWWVADNRAKRQQKK